MRGRVLYPDSIIERTRDGRRINAFFYVTTTIENQCSYCRHRVADHHRSQAGAAIESICLNGLHRVRDFDISQAGATIESRPSDCLHRVGECNFFNGSTSLKEIGRNN